MSRQPNPKCPHPDYALQFRQARPATPATPERRGGATRQQPQGYIIQYARDAYLGNPDEMICTECDWSYRVNGAEGFVRVREEKWEYDHGCKLFIADMFGTEIKKGSMVVYPTLSGRSATLSYGEIVEVNPPSKTYGGPPDWGTIARQLRCNQPFRLKVQPRPYTSRWKSSTGDDGKPVTLTANAPSVVVMS